MRNRSQKVVLRLQGPHFLLAKRSLLGSVSFCSCQCCGLCGYLLLFSLALVLACCAVCCVCGGLFCLALGVCMCVVCPVSSLSAYCFRRGEVRPPLSILLLMFLSSCILVRDWFWLVSVWARVHVGACACCSRACVCVCVRAHAALRPLVFRSVLFFPCCAGEY